MSQPLPQAHFLTYITGAATTTKVRRVVTWGLRTAALLQLLPALLLALYLAHLYRDSATSWTFYTPYSLAPGASTAPSALLFSPVFFLDFLRHNAVDFLTLLALTTAGLTLLLTGRSAGNAHRPSCFAALFSLLPLFLALTFLAVYSGIAALYLCVLYDQAYIYLLLLIPTALAILAILLLKDLAAYTLWAANNPLTEKPAAAFVTGRPLPIPDTPLPIEPCPADSLPLADPPSSLVLSYLTTNATPRKLRLILTWGLRSAALLALLPALVITYTLVGDYRSFRPPGMPRRYALYTPSFRAADILSFLQYNALLAAAALLLFASALTLLLTASRAARANRPACILALLALLPVALVTLFETFNFTLIPVAAIASHDPDATAKLLNNFIPALLCLLLTLLLKDLFAFTLWSLRHPHLEKPKTPFLPLPRPTATDPN